MRIFLIALIGCFLYSLQTMAQKKSHYFYGGVFDVDTEQVVDSVWVELLHIDGSLVERQLACKNHIVGRGRATWKFSSTAQTVNYILRFYRQGYEMKEVSLPAFTFKKMERGKRLFDVYLQPIGEHVLDEATVVAHKISFFHQGDTLIFNMRALEFGDGSMLEVLVRQTPSMELKKDGKIFSNGRMIESVLLDGEDFFGVDGGVMLNNLPAYMVKRIHVYEKQSQFSEYVEKDMEKRELVMDVELKEQYKKGWTGQILGGGGTNERYMSRFMAMYFSPQLRLSFYGNVNNLNILRQPGEDDGWTPEDIGDKLKTTQLGGVDLLLSDTAGLYTFASHSEVKHQMEDGDLEMNSVNFLPTGDAYQHAWTGSHLNTLDFSTSNSFELHPNDKTWFNATLDLQFFKGKENGNQTDATFSQKVIGPDVGHLRDSLRLQTLPSDLGKITLNRNETLSKARNKTLTGSSELSFQRRFRTNDLLNLSANFTYQQCKEETYDVSLADFPAADHTEKEYLYRYGNHEPDRVSTLHLNTSYFHWLDEAWVLTPMYDAEISVTKARYQLYDLHRMEGFSWENAPQLGLLPNGDLTAVNNVQNSYDQHEVDGTHSVGLRLKWQKNGWFVQWELPVRFSHRKMTYERGQFHRTFTKQNCHLEPVLDAFYHWGDEVDRKVELTYACEHELPLMTDYVEEVNDVDPLEVYLGNSDIKSSIRHTATLSFRRNRKSVNRSFGTTLEAVFTPRDCGELTGFDYHKGVTYYKKYNTYGTYSLGHTTAFSSPLWTKYSPWRLKNESAIQYVHGADYTQENMAAKVNRNLVHTVSMADHISLHFHRSDWRSFVKLGVEWNRAISNRPDFESINVGHFHYGFSLTTPKLWGIQLSTDLTKYNRYGYDFSSRKKELIWNVRVSREFGRNWLVYFDGFDLLHRLSGISHALNAQGRIETVCHSIPRYAMLHVVYKFSKTGGKK